MPELKNILNKERLKEPEFFLKWLCIGVITGGIIGLVGALFHFCSAEAEAFRGDNTWLIYLLPVAGAAIAYFYDAMKYSHDQGTNLVLLAVRDNKIMGIRHALCIFVATVLTHLCGGSSGREGASLQIGAALGSFSGRKLKFGEDDKRIMTMCGMSAMFAAVFGTPVTAAIFAMEVVSVGIFYYSAIIPCVTSALTASYISSLFGNTHLQVSVNVPKADLILYLKIALIGAICAGISVLFCQVIGKTHKLFKKIKNHAYKADDLLTNKWLGFPILIIFMWLMFQATFTIGAYPQAWIESAVEWFGSHVASWMNDGILRDLIVDGIIAGVGGVLVFLPNILILFMFISILEDTGYMARAAFIMDRLMHKIGLHGKSFIPFLIGFGCSVPAIMATRTLENRKDRIVTVLVTPFMSCSARLPVYLLFVAAFFHKNQGLILLSVYLVGAIIAILTALLLNKTAFRGLSEQFVMELPPYRIPTMRNTLIHMWDKSVQYLQKMATVILVASIIIWALEYFPRTSEESEKIAQEIELIEK